MDDGTAVAYPFIQHGSLDPQYTHVTLRKSIANVVTGGAVVRAQRERIATMQNRREMRRQVAAIRARYEAAFWNTARSYLPGFIQNASEDINALSRQEILRRTRYFEKNNAVMEKVLAIKEVNVIGSGLRPSPRAQDWGKDALEWWDEWIEVADISGLSSLPKLQAIAYRGQMIDGDSFYKLTSTPTGRPAIDVIEAHRCGTGGFDIGALEASGLKVIDGVVVDRVTKRPVLYLIADEFDASTVTAHPASTIVPVWDRKRGGQYRGLTLFHAGILDLHDLDDLQKYEMRAAKDAASISRIVESAAGAVSVDDAIGASLNALPQTDPQSRPAYYRQALGGEVLVTQPGDKISQFQSSRPSAAVTGFWDRLDIKFAQGSGISYAALVDYRGNWGGATLRAAIASDNKHFELQTIDQMRAAQRIWEYAIGWAIEHRELPPHPDWRKVRWHPPRRTTVDIGHDSDAMLNELKAGTRTYEEILGEIGEDWRERLDQRAQEEAYITNLAVKYGVTKGEIASFAMERLTGMAPDATGPANLSGETDENGNANNPPQEEKK